MSAHVCAGNMADVYFNAERQENLQTIEVRIRKSLQALFVISSSIIINIGISIMFITIIIVIIVIIIHYVLIYHQGSLQGPPGPEARSAAPHRSYLSSRERDPNPNKDLLMRKLSWNPLYEGVIRWVRVPLLASDYRRILRAAGPTNSLRRRVDATVHSGIVVIMIIIIIIIIMITTIINTIVIIIVIIIIIIVVVVTIVIVIIQLTIVVIKIVVVVIIIIIVVVVVGSSNK